MKWNEFFFQAAPVSILLYGCTTWTLTKRPEKKLDSHYTRMLRTILNKSWRQHLTKQHLYGHLQPITKTIHVRRTRNAGLYWKSKATYSCGPLHMDEQIEPIYHSSVPIQYVDLKTYRERWTTKTCGERGSGRDGDMMMMMNTMFLHE